jgi:translation initiation factor IF-3
MIFARLHSIANARINNQINAPELRIIDDKGENLGVMKLEEAKTLAKSKGLDLIEISAKAIPPVARIMSYDKFRYQEEKKRKKQRAMEKNADFKRVQLGLGTATHDLEIKAGLANDFLHEGHTVEIFMMLRGREKANKNFGIEKMNAFLKMIAPHKLLMSPRFTGRGITAQIAKA